MKKSLEEMRKAREAAEAARIAEQNQLMALPVEQHTFGTVERLSSENYGRMLRNPEFAKRVDELESKRPPRPRN